MRRTDRLSSTRLVCCFMVRHGPRWKGRGLLVTSCPGPEPSTWLVTCVANAGPKVIHQVFPPGSASFPAFCMETSGRVSHAGGYAKDWEHLRPSRPCPWSWGQVWGQVSASQSLPGGNWPAWGPSPKEAVEVASLAPFPLCQGQGGQQPQLGLGPETWA